MKPIILVVLLCAASFYFVKLVSTSNKSLLYKTIKTSQIDK